MIVIDMKKPETCADCHIINGEYGICEILDREVWGIPPKDCPIVGEIPGEHGRLIDADQLQEVLNLTLSLVITNQLTEKEISLVHRTIGAISEAINDLDTVLEATE